MRSSKLATREDSIPLRENLHQLPKWSKVAFAARTARRAVAIFEDAFADCSARQMQTINMAIDLASKASTEQFEADHPHVAKINDAGAAAESLAKILLATNSVAAWIALAAANAATAAALACQGNRKSILDHAVKSVECAMEAGGKRMMESVQSDWRKVCRELTKERE